MRIRILRRAEQDLIDGFLFYERQQEGIGEYFLDSLFSDIDSLHLFAGIHALHFGFHRLLSRRFPFAVYYRIEEGAVCVYAVLDCRKNPLHMQDRLD